MNKKLYVSWGEVWENGVELPLEKFLDVNGNIDKQKVYEYVCENIGLDVEYEIV